MGCWTGVLEAGGVGRVEVETIQSPIDQLDASTTTMDSPDSEALHAWKNAPDAASPRRHLNGDPTSGGEELIGEVLLCYGLRNGDYVGG